MAVKEFVEAQPKPPPPEPTPAPQTNISNQLWKKPPRGFLKVNTYAAFTPHNKKTTGAIIIRDENGTLTWGLTRKSFASSPLLAEAIILRDAVVTADNMHWENIVFESDNQKLIQACRGEIQLGETKHITEDIQNWSKNYTNWRFSWTRRSGNEAAHCVADLSHHGNLPSSWIWHSKGQIHPTSSSCSKWSQFPPPTSACPNEQPHGHPLPWKRHQNWFHLLPGA